MSSERGSSHPALEMCLGAAMSSSVRCLSNGSSVMSVRSSPSLVSRGMMCCIFCPVSSRSTVCQQLHRHTSSQRVLKKKRLKHSTIKAIHYTNSNKP